MRVISGSLGGRNFQSPSGDATHPMADKIRGALFNALGDLNGLRALDAFSGSGALSFEAVSRGAVSVTAIDSNAAAQNIITKNIRLLGLSNQVHLVKASAEAWLKYTQDMYDIVLLDPPYDRIPKKVLPALAERTNVGGIVVLSLPPNVENDLLVGFEMLKTKEYGDAQLVFYRRVS